MKMEIGETRVWDFNLVLNMYWRWKRRNTSKNLYTVGLFYVHMSPGTGRAVWVLSKLGSIVHTHMDLNMFTCGLAPTICTRP